MLPGEEEEQQAAEQRSHKSHKHKSHKHKHKSSHKHRSSRRDDDEEGKPPRTKGPDADSDVESGEILDPAAATDKPTASDHRFDPSGSAAAAPAAAQDAADGPAR
jgi:hypothetical protein